MNETTPNTSRDSLTRTFISSGPSMHFCIFLISFFFILEIISCASGVIPSSILAKSSFFHSHEGSTSQRSNRFPVFLEGYDVLFEVPVDIDFLHLGNAEA